MYFRSTLNCIILPILVIVTMRLLVKRNAVNLSDTIHYFPEHNVDPVDMMQTMQIMMQMLLNQTTEIEDLNQQSEKDRSTIQTLQNKVFFLEAGQNELSKLPSSQEFSTYLSGMNHLTQNSVANEAIVKNLTLQLHGQSTELENLRQQFKKCRSNIQHLNGSLTNVIGDVHDQIANKSSHHAFSAGISSGNAGWIGITLVFPNVIYGEGTGYNPSTGIFTSPTEGTYMFYISVQSYNHKDVQLDIVMNGSIKVRAMAWYYSGNSIAIQQTGNNLVILNLQTNDRVSVKRYAGVGYYSNGAHIMTFSGFKLY